MKKAAIVIHSGGMDSSITLALALKKFSQSQILSLSFSYNQRHIKEIIHAKKICQTWGVDHEIVEIDFLSKICQNALTNRDMDIKHEESQAPNTLVVGRNGLMVRVAGMLAYSMKANFVFAGVMEYEDGNSGYRDCSREYMDLMERVLQIDLDNPNFKIITPLVHMTKKESLEVAYELGVLPFLLNETITCYEGKSELGCQTCPACLLRNNSIRAFAKEHPNRALPDYLS